MPSMFAEAWGVKYDKAVEWLIKDRDALLAFDFPAEHWKHLSTTNLVTYYSRRCAPHRALQGMSLKQDRTR
jgi:transposase-like protein